MTTKLGGWLCDINGHDLPYFEVIWPAFDCSTGMCLPRACALRRSRNICGI